MAESTGVLLAEGAFAGVVAQEQETYRTILEAGVARLQQLGLEPVAELRVGEPGHEIASFALEVAADLVVVGHRRRSGLQRWWAAGAGVHLLDQLDCSLLIARHDISDNALRRPLRQREVEENQTAARAVDVGCAVITSDQDMGISLKFRSKPRGWRMPDLSLALCRAG